MKRLGKQWFFIVTAFILVLTYVSLFGVKNYYGDKEIVHMGDNYMSDVLTAGKAGFEAVYYRRKA